MHSVKGKKWNRRLSFLLVLVLLFGDSSLQYTMAAESGETRLEAAVSVSGGDPERTSEPEQSAEPGQQRPK